MKAKQVPESRGGGRRTARPEQRWAERKAQQRQERFDERVNAIAEAGGGIKGRRSLFWRHQHLARVKADLAKAEHIMLETTSLKDLIK